MSLDGRIMLFNALIKPYFVYGIELWYASAKSTRDTLELLLRHCIRIVLNDTGRIPMLSNALIYSPSDVFPLSALFQLQVGQMLFKY